MRGNCRILELHRGGTFYQPEREELNSTGEAISFNKGFGGRPPSQRLEDKNTGELDG